MPAATIKSNIFHSGYIIALDIIFAVDVGFMYPLMSDKNAPKRHIARAVPMAMPSGIYILRFKIYIINAASAATIIVASAVLRRIFLVSFVCIASFP